MKSKWNELIETPPDFQTVRQRAARARRQALDAWDGVQTPGRPSGWIPKLAFAAPVLAMLLIVGSTQTENPAAPTPAAASVEQEAQQQRLVMNMQLSDGTQVQWTFDDRFAL